jgi:hypothetical protein
MSTNSVRLNQPFLGKDEFLNKREQETSNSIEAKAALKTLTQESSQAQLQLAQKPIKPVKEVSHSRLKKIGLISGGLLLGAGVCFAASQSLWPSVPNQNVDPSTVIGKTILNEPVVPMANEIPREFQVFIPSDYKVLNPDTGTNGVMGRLFISKLPLEYRYLKPAMSRLEAFYREKNITDIEPMVYTKENGNNLRKYLEGQNVELTRKTSLWEQWNGSPKEVDNGVFDQYLEDVLGMLGIFNKLIQDNAPEPSHVKAIDMHLEGVKSEHLVVRRTAARRAVRLPFRGNQLELHIKHHFIREKFVLPETDSITTSNIGWGNSANGGNFWIQC